MDDNTEKLDFDEKVERGLIILLDPDSYYKEKHEERSCTRINVKFPTTNHRGNNNLDRRECTNRKELPSSGFIDAFNMLEMGPTNHDLLNLTPVEKFLKSKGVHFSPSFEIGENKLVAKK